MKEIVNFDYVKSWFTSYLGQTSINGSNCANEPAHNAYSQNATEFGLIKNNQIIGIGNNGKPIEWKDYVDYFVHSRKPVGKRQNESGFWGVGGSKIFPIRFGVPEYVATKIDDKYYKYQYNWEGFDINQPFTADDAVNKFTQLSIEKIEVDESEYRKLVYADKFENLPTFFFCIKRYVEDDITFSAGNIIKNLNNTFCACRNKIKYFVAEDDKSPLYGEQIYFPTVVNGEVTYDITLLDKVDSNVHIAGGIFDVYHYKYEVSDYSVVNAFQIAQKTNDYKNIFQAIGSRGPSTSYNHFFNTESLHLTSVSKGGKELSDVMYNYSNCIFLQTGGIFKYSTVKSAVIDEKLDIASTQIHKSYVDSNSTKQHKGNKGEDTKVIECYNEIFEDKPNKANIMASIQFLSDYTLTPLDIKNELNHLNFRPIGAREHDWAIKKQINENYNINLEFMNDSADWGHIDKLNYTLDEDVIPYHVLIVDSYSKQKEKINSFKKVLSNKIVPHIQKVWVVTLNDFISFNEKNMLSKGLIFEKS